MPILHSRYNKKKHEKTIYISSVMFLDEYMNIYISIKIVYIRDIQNGMIRVQYCIF